MLSNTEISTMQDAVEETCSLWRISFANEPHVKKLQYKGTSFLPPVSQLEMTLLFQGFGLKQVHS